MLIFYLFLIVSAVCNPTTSTCAPVAALGSSFKQDLSSDIGEYFSELPKKGEITYTSEDGISLIMNKQLDNPTIHSNFYIMFGKVEVVMKAALGTGVISSFYLQSDDLDEIDIELFGGDNYEFQSNYFVKGSTTTYDRGVYHPTNPGPLTSYHTYTIDWTPEQLTWSLDGNVVRTLPKDNPQGYPQAPMQIIAGVWAGGDPTNEPGTILWAGGPTDFSQAPFVMSMKSIIVSDYSSGDTYSYSGTSGTWQSIVAENGEVNGREEEGRKEFDTLASGGSVNEKPLAVVSSAESSSEKVSASTLVAASSSSSAASSAASSTRSSTGGQKDVSSSSRPSSNSSSALSEGSSATQIESSNFSAAGSSTTNAASSVRSGPSSAGDSDSVPSSSIEGQQNSLLDSFEGKASGVTSSMIGLIAIAISLIF